MNCTYCGSYVEPGTKFCPSCGAPQPVQAQPQPQPQPVNYTTNNYYQQPYQQPTYQQPQQSYQPPYQAPNPYAPANLSYADFYNRYASKKTRNYVTWMAVIFFFTAAISLVFLLALENTLAILDILVYGIMGAALLASKQTVFAVVPTIYGAIWSVIGMANGNTPSGVVAIIVGVACMGQLAKVQKAYNKYKQDGLAPTEEL